MCVLGNGNHKPKGDIMKGLGTIRAENREAGAAAEAEKKPFVVEQAVLEGWKALREAGRAVSFPFPRLGDHVPEGWEQVDSLFCDATGLGEAWEPALTIDQLLEKLEVGKGYAITSVDQFQLYLGVYEKTD